MHLNINPSPNDFKGVILYYPEGNTDIQIGPYMCPFGVNRNYGKEEVSLSVESENDVISFGKIDKIVNEFAEENEFPVDGKGSLTFPRNPEYKPTLKVKLNKNTIIYDKDNIVQDSNYIDKFDRLVCDICVSCIWKNDNTYGITYKADKIQVFKEQKAKKSKKPNNTKYSFKDE